MTKVRHGPHVCARALGCGLGWGRHLHLFTSMKLIPHFCPVCLQDSACKHGFLFLSNVPNSKTLRTSASLGRSSVIIAILACLWKPQSRQESNFLGRPRNWEHTPSHCGALGREAWSGLRACLQTPEAQAWPPGGRAVGGGSIQPGGRQVWSKSQLLQS